MNVNLKNIGRRAALLAVGILTLGAIPAAPSALAVTNDCPRDSGGYLWHFQNHGDSNARITVTAPRDFKCTIDVSSGHGNEFFAGASRGDLTFALKYGVYNTTFGPYKNNTNTCFRILDDGELDLVSTGNNCNTN
ncbi:hypothetical protein JNUCC0626_47590 [Lentzea sp. JNUCC 0626]|uniref:hypothetical protein n=1 Tax=Lentzea sp. JNUCC 0626 TaxID=3367513 RepID=UPI003748E0A5